MLALCLEEGRVDSTPENLARANGESARDERGGEKRGEMRGLTSDNEPRLDGGPR